MELVFGKFKGRNIEQIPNSYLKWVLHISRRRLSKKLRQAIKYKLDNKYKDIYTYGRCLLWKSNYILNKDVGGFIQAPHIMTHDFFYKLEKGEEVTVYRTEDEGFIVIKEIVTPIFKKKLQFISNVFYN